MSSAPAPPADATPPPPDATPPPPDATSPPPPDATPPPPEATTPPPPDATTPPPVATPPPPDATPPPPDAIPPPPDVTPPPPDVTPPPPDTTPPPPDVTPPPPDATPPPVDVTPPPADATPPPADITPPPPEATPPPVDVTPPPTPVVAPPSPDVTQPPPSPAVPSGSPPPLPKGTPALPAAPPPPKGTPALPAAQPPPYGGQPTPKETVSTSLVVGVAVGGVVIVLLLALFGVCCWTKKRRRSDIEYPPPPPAVKDGGYWQHQSTPAPGFTGPLPPPPFASRPFQPGSLPPPPAMNSSGGSGSQYSNSEATLQSSASGVSIGMTQSTFSYEELVMATDGFSDANLLGQGGFGYVHRGVLPNGKEVAVKQLKSGSGQGEREFQAEVEIISRVHHKHLVSLVGYCMSGGKRLLVYEFVPNNTMEFHLHGKGRPTMDWSTRLRIALGSAKGLAYLHEDCHPRIIHRDIKATNILLDYKFEAKVADFGLAKLSEEGNTHISTRVMGTFGYLAPEYASSGKLTDKSDVFSFGVMLLELITGRRPVDSNQSFMDDSLVDWARPLLLRALEEGNHDALVDEKLGKDYNPSEMACMIACAAACVRHSAKRRPRMSQVVRALEGEVSLEDLNEGIKPGHSRFMSSYGSTDYDSSQYNEDMKKFRKMALTSQEYTSSEYSMPTSEYGMNASGSSSEGQRTQEMEMRKAKKDVHRYDNF